MDKMDDWFGDDDENNSQGGEENNPDKKCEWRGILKRTAVKLLVIISRRNS